MTLLAITAGGLFTAIGQTNSEEESIIELSAFIVSVTDDRGYRSTNSTAGTSLNTVIRDIPMSLEVINAELISDLHATDMKESLDYSAGVFINTYENVSSSNAGTESRDRSPSSNVSVNNPFADTIVIRGYVVPNQQRFGFRVGSIVPAYSVILGGFTDSSNIERLEVVRGPQSLLYGINVLSGIVNIMPKQPLPQQRTQLSFEVGNYEYYRGVLDHTGPILADGSLNYRVVASHTNQGDWTDYLEDRTEYYAAQLDWKITPKVKLFIEGQYGDSRRKGGGMQFFTDGGTLRDPNFFNRYGERYTFGRDFFNEDIITDAAFAPGGLGQDRRDVTGQLLYGNSLLVEKPGVDYLFPDLGPETRLSGPDVLRRQREYDLLALLHAQPSRNLSLEAGAYYTHVEVYERNVDMSVFNNSTGTVTGANFPFNPEADASALIGYGVGELFTAPNRLRSSAYGTTLDDTKYGRYIWYEKPTESDSIQLRAKAAYKIETEWFNGRLPAIHTLSGGINYIKDEVHFVNGTVTDTGAYSVAGTITDGFTGSRLDSDPFFLRNIFDYSVLRYTGQPMAIPGYVTNSGLTDITAADPIVRSGWQDVDMWYKGSYAVYHGNFLQDRINLIAGIRQDSYQVKESEQLRIADQLRETDRWQGGGSWPVIDELIGYGDRPYVWREGLPDSLNARVEDAINRLRLSQPDGTVGYNFDQDQRFTTKTFGLSYRVIDPLSLFFLYSEGVFPNTGQRDGSYRAIDAEQTRNTELGMKFEFLDGKVSGSVSAFKIHRENAVWDWPFAPNPSRWYGSPTSPATEGDTFSPQAVLSGTNSVRYGVAERYVVQAFEEAGLEMPKNRGRYEVPSYMPYGVVQNGISTSTTGNPADLDETDTYFYVDYEQMMALPDNPLKRAMDLAVRDQASPGAPIRYYGNTSESYSASRASVVATNVLYEEEGVGFDGNILITPVPNYQVLLSFSHQKREVVGSGFKLAPGYQIDAQGNRVDDRLWTTEYDIWVYQLGPDNFEDPRDPTTLKGSAVNGVDLSFVPRNSFRIWNKYSFTEGPLAGLSIGGGVRWNSSIATTAGVGGERLASNRYPTPDIPARYVVDLLFSYRMNLGRLGWTFALKINNLLDDKYAERIAEYTTDSGESIFRRTRQYYEPINFRLSVSTEF